MIDRIKQNLAGLPTTWTVSDNFTVTAPKGASASDVNQAANDTASLQSLAETLGHAIDKWAPKISEAVAELGQLAPSTAEKHTVNPDDQFTAQQAQTDLQAVRNGTADAATLARLKAATTLAADEKDALANGKGVNLPQFEYLQGLSKSMNGMNGTDIANLGSKLPGNGKDQVQAAIANDFRLVSDTQVHSAGLNGGIGALTGGMNQLPDTIQNALKSKPSDLAEFNTLNSLGTVMSKGDTTIQGSDINRGMMKQGAEIAALTATHSALKDGPLPGVANALLNDASGDHSAIHDSILANPNSSDPDARAAADRMSATCANGGKYYGNQHVLDILQHQWSPDQHGAQNVFKWIGDDATLPKGTFANNEAGQTAYGLASILGDSNNKSLLNSPDNPLGAKNPALTQTLANTLSPYLGNLAGVTDAPGLSILNSAPVDSSGHQLQSPFHDSGELGGMLAVLDSDPQAARTINSAGMQWHDVLEYASGVNTDHAASLQANAANLQSALNNGLTTDINAHAAERAYQASQDYANKGVFADGVTSVVQTGATIAGPESAVAVPVVNGIAATVDSYIKADVIPNPADPAHPLADDKVSTELQSILKSTNNDTIRDEYLQTQGYVQKHPEAASYFEQSDGSNLTENWNNVASGDGLNTWRNDYNRFSHDMNLQLPETVFNPPNNSNTTPINESEIAPRGDQKPPGAK
ncbi:TPR repeat region-containing protein [Nocardia macrotermitis]|uniref:TPR repeat region-containing protein n=1 Tax=Nocardia macrotermitis TaxID=2585198 RepID=UPI001294F603|nr:hypothetical protein [Nocardia macrotermitis]